MIISKTPLRISLAGGGSDLREYYAHAPGSVISTAIDKYVYITVNKKFFDGIRVGYSKTELVDSVDAIEHNLVREALRLTGINKRIDITYMSDLLSDKEGSGLGASSSLLVGTLHALHAFKGEYVSSEQLSKESCTIEIDVLGHPIGKQDQYATSYGGFNHIQFHADETTTVTPLITPPGTKERLNNNLLLFYTGLKKRSDEILTEQKANTRQNKHTLDTMVGLADTLVHDLQQGNLDNVGSILHENWLLKKTLSSNISNPIIDAHYDAALKVGAQGGKILGSGGGGFLLFYCPEDTQGNVRAALSDLRELKFSFEQEGSKIVYIHNNNL